MVAPTTKRTVASAASIVLMTAVPPVVLALIGWPTGTSELTADYVWLSLRALSLPTPLLLTLLTAAAWLVWGVFALLVAADAAAIIRGRTPRLALMKLVAAGLAGGALTATAAAPALAAAPPASPVVASAPAHTADSQAEGGQHAPAEDSRQDIRPSNANVSPPSSSPPPPSPRRQRRPSRPPSNSSSASEPREPRSR